MTPSSACRAADFNAPPDTPFYSDLRYSLKQYAAFGEATWNLSQHFAITGGLRYYKYNEDKDLLFAGLFADVTPGVVPASTDSSGTSPRVILSFKPTDDVQFNAQASRGFRLGGINDPINLPLCSATDKLVFGNQPNWKDEKTWNYEVGAKTQWLDKRVTFNLAVFYADITDLQATTTAGTCSSRVVFNVPTARSQGIEAELFARPNVNWDFGISADVIDAKLTSSVTSTLPDGTVVVVGGLADGNRLPTAPKTQAAAFIGYTLPMSSERDLFANLTFQYVGTSFSQFENEEPGFGQIGGTGGPECGAPDPLRRPVLGLADQLQCRAAQLHADELPHRRQNRALAGGCLCEQPHRYQHHARARLRARTQCARRLPDQPAAHLRHLRGLHVLGS